MAFGSGVRPWTRGTKAKVTASTAVLGQGEILVDDTGGLYAGDGATQIKNLKRAVRGSELVFNPLDYGAVGDGVADDTTKVQAAIDAAVAAGGGLVIAPRGYKFKIPAGIDFTTPTVSYHSYGGWLTGGQVRVGHATTAQDFTGVEFRNLLLDGLDPQGAASKGVVLRNARGVRFAGGHIKNLSRGLSVDSNDGAAGFHTLGKTSIEGTKFSYTNYNIYTDTATWDVCSDWRINGLVGSDTTRIKNIRMSGCDGAQITDCTFFMPSFGSGVSYLTDKQENVYFGFVRQLHVHNNQFFEAGLSALRLDDAAGFTITGNAFIWPGQISQADCIEIRNGTLSGTIAGNKFDNWTRAAIGIYGTCDVSTLEISGNAFHWAASMSSNLTGVTLSSANVFRYFHATTVVGLPAVRDASNGLAVFDSWGSSTRVESRDQKGLWSGIGTSLRRSATVTAQTAIFTMSDFTGSLLFDGKIVVVARSGGTSTAKSAVYELLVSSSGPNCVTVAQTGFITGAAADQPSFTWQIVGTDLRATPIGSTSGSFWFEATTVGALALR